MHLRCHNSYVSTIHPISKKVGRRIRDERLKRGVSQEALAFKSKMSRNFISMIERGERNITVAKLHSLASALGLEAWELLKGLK